MSLIKALENEEKLIQQQLQQLQARLEAIQLLKGKTVISPTAKEAEQEYIKSRAGKQLPVPAKYSPKLAVVQKIYLCLKAIETGTVHDIADQLKKFDSKEYKDKTFTHKVAANGVFLLNKTGVLNMTSMGKSRYYSLK